MSANVHTTVILGKNVVLGKNVTIDAYAIIDDNVTVKDCCKIGSYTRLCSNVYLGENTIIESHCLLGPSGSCSPDLPLVIGSNSLVRSHAIIYGGTTIGDHFSSGHRVTVREGVEIGHHTKIASLCHVNGYCKIGNYVSILDNTHVSQLTTIKDYVWIFAYVLFTNTPTPPSDEFMGVTVESFAVVASGAILLPGIIVHQDALVGAGSIVTKDVPTETLVLGSPASAVCNVREIVSKISGKSVYPWRTHFNKGMPWEQLGFDQWIAANNEVALDLTPKPNDNRTP
jgi:acetyltransferase-like isoleucine patch superfamily enzyme